MPERPRGASSLTARIRAEDEILFLLGGPLAERAAGLRRSSRWRRDRSRAAEVALRYCGGDPEEANALLRWLDVRATKFVGRHWGEIEALARALLAEQVLDAPAIRAVLHPRIDAPPLATSVPDVSRDSGRVPGSA